MSSPSSLQREAACLASVVLPHTGSASPYSFRGTELHRFLSNVAKLGRDAALADCDEKLREAARAIDLSLFPPMNPETGRADVTLAWRETGEAKELPGKRDSEVAAAHREAGWFVGELDWSALTEDAVVVLDFKFGYLSIAPADVNLQIMAYAVMSAAAFNRKRAVVGIGRVLENGEPWFDVTELDELGLEAAASRLRKHLRKVEEVKAAYAKHQVLPEPVEGPQCRYCPAYASCPAKAQLAHAAVSGELTREVALTVKSAGELWPKLMEAQRVIEKLIGDVKGLAKLQRIPLPDGTVLGLVEGMTRSLEPGLTADYVAGHFDPALVSVGDVVKTTQSATMKDLEAAVKKTCTPGKRELAGKMRKVEAEMLKTGGMRAFRYERVEAVAADSKRLLPEVEPQTISEALLASLKGTGT